MSSSGEESFQKAKNNSVPSCRRAESFFCLRTCRPVVGFSTKKKAFRGELGSNAHLARNVAETVAPGKMSRKMRRRKPLPHHFPYNV